MKSNFRIRHNSFLTKCKFIQYWKCKYHYLKTSHTVKLQIRIAGIIAFFSFSWVKMLFFIHFLCNKLMQNAGIIRNVGFIGGPALIDVLRYDSLVLIFFINFRKGLFTYYVTDFLAFFWPPTYPCNEKYVFGWTTSSYNVRFQLLCLSNIWWIVVENPDIRLNLYYPPTPVRKNKGFPTPPTYPSTLR